MSERTMRESLMIQLFLALAEERPRRRAGRARPAIHARPRLTSTRRPRPDLRPA